MAKQAPTALTSNNNNNNTTGVHLHLTLEFTIMEMPKHFSLPTPGNFCIFIYELRPPVPTGPVLHPAMCLLRREDSLNPKRVKNTLVAGEHFLRWGCGTLAQQTISQTIHHNKSNCQTDLDPAPLPSVFLPKFSSQTDIGVEIVQS